MLPACSRASRAPRGTPWSLRHPGLWHAAAETDAHAASRIARTAKQMATCGARNTTKLAKLCSGAPAKAHRPKQLTIHAELW